MEKEFFVSGSGAQDMEGQGRDLNCASERLPNGYLNLNWENSMDHSGPFDSAMSSFVSSPAAGTNGRGPESIVIRELIGRLGSICNSNDISRQSHSHTLNYMGESNASANTSCYTTPLNSPPKINNLSMIGDRHVSVPSHSHPGLTPFPTDPGFAERAARFSCFGTKSMGGLMGQFGFNEMEMPQQPQRLARPVELGKLSRVSSSQSLKVAVRENKEFETDRRSISANERKFSKMSRSSSPDNAEFSNAFASEPTVEDANMKGVGDVNGRKRKAAPRGKAKDFTSSRDAKEVAEDAKRCKSNETSGNEKLSAKTKMELNGTSSNGGSSEASKKQNKETPKPSPEPPKDYIHVRARRGQATDSHSLAERVRREKISERMKFLQDLVPGCNKVTGKALMLDEIINYVQSLQRQVEFLSMKLATVNPRLDFNMETTLTKDLLQSRESLSQAMYQLNSSVSAFQYGHPGEGVPMSANRAEPLCSMNPLEATALHRNTGLELPSLDGFGEAAAHFANFWEDDLQSVVQMGFGQNQSQETAFESQSFPGSLSTTNMKVEL